jgi:hypothetical protein
MDTLLLPDTGATGASAGTLYASQRNIVLVVRLVLGLLFLFGLFVVYRQYQTFKQIYDLRRIESTMIAVAENFDLTRRVEGLCSQQAARAGEALNRLLQALQDGMLCGNLPADCGGSQPQYGRHLTAFEHGGRDGRAGVATY